MKMSHKKSALRALFLFQAFFVRYGEFVTAFCSATCQHFAAFFGAHALAETVLVGAFAARRLKCPFHRCFCLICFYTGYGLDSLGRPSPPCIFLCKPRELPSGLRPYRTELTLLCCKVPQR